MSSSSVRRSPASSAASSAVRRSSPGLRPLPIDDLVEVHVHVVAAVERGGEVLVGDDRIEGLHERSRPGAQLQPVLSFRHAEHVGDHREGERERDVGDHVELGVGPRVGVGDEILEERLHAGSEAFDDARCEDLGDEPAEAVVVGRVEIEHRPVAAAAIADQRLALGVHHRFRHDGVAVPRPRATDRAAPAARRRSRRASTCRSASRAPDRAPAALRSEGTGWLGTPDRTD